MSVRASLTLLVAFAASCVESGSELAPIDIDYLCTIDTPTEGPTYETTDAALFMSGDVFYSPGGSSCCPFDGHVTVQWTNLANGAEGTAEINAVWQQVPLFGIVVQEHRWSAELVPLELGDNPIEILASDRLGRTGHASLLVRRS